MFSKARAWARCALASATSRVVPSRSPNATQLVGKMMFTPCWHFRPNHLPGTTAALRALDPPGREAPKLHATGEEAAQLFQDLTEEQARGLGKARARIAARIGRGHLTLGQGLRDWRSALEASWRAWSIARYLHDRS
jgi:hypothetical protein